MSFPSRPIAVQGMEEQGLVSHVRLDKPQYLNADRDKVVEGSSEEAAFFYGGPGKLVPKEEAERLGASYEGDASGDELLDVVHVEVETPNVLPGPRVEGSGKATIPVTQADRAAQSDPRKRAAVSGKDRRKTEGEEFLEGNLKPLPDQVEVGRTGQAKQVAQMEPAHYTEEEKESSGAAQTDQPQTSAGGGSQQAASKRAGASSNKQAERPLDK